MLNKEFFEKIRREYADYETARRELIKNSGDALAFSKQAIFALHRGDAARAEALLADARAIQRRIAEKFASQPELVSEGSYRAMLEEFVEATLLSDFAAGEEVGPVEAPGIDADAWLGGLLDLTGELVRRAVAAATAKNDAEVRRCHEAVEAVVGELILMNITGPLRPKYDQLKSNLRKLEEIRYDLSLRSR